MTLPDYSGPLKPAPWGQVRLTGRSKRILRMGAAKGCPTCLGRGFTGGAISGLPCVCLNASLPRKRSTV